MEPIRDGDGRPIEEVIGAITSLNDEIRDFWSTTDGWAPADAQRLLSSSRLDRQVSLSHCLAIWIGREREPALSDGLLILGWVNLGALVEGSLKWFLSVYLENYPEADDPKAPKRKGKLLEPDRLELEQLRAFFSERVWTDSQRELWDPWLVRVRDRRNAIHAYREREIGDFKSLESHIRSYLALLEELNGQVPYP